MDLVNILDKIGFDFHVFIFNLANFLLLAWLLKKFLFSKIAKIVDERHHVIADGVSKLEIADSELSMARLNAENELRAARENGRDIVSEAAKRAVENSEQIRNEAMEDAKTIIENAKITAEREKISILENVRKEAAEIIAEEVANKINDKNK
jgi:F-type H+-transporting ATPase subunit b